MIFNFYIFVLDIGKPQIFAKLIDHIILNEICQI